MKLVILDRDGTLNHTSVALLSGAVGEVKAASQTLSVARVATDTQGAYRFLQIDQTSYGLTASRSTSDSGSAITSADALAALRISVGLNPNPDPDGAGPLAAPAVSPYQFMAADVTGSDGKISSADALAILRMAVKLPTAPSEEWLFVPENRDYWDEASGKFTLDRTHASWDHSISADVQTNTTLNLVGLLKGDVNASWVAPTGSVDLDLLDPSYFNTLQNLFGTPLAQWGI